MLRLPPFEYHRPGALDGALELLARHGAEAMPIAGGTDLVPNMKHRLFTPRHLIALSGLDELRGIREVPSDEGSRLRIGAGETLAAVAASGRVRALVPALAEAARHVAGPQLRNRGTIGGNLLLDTRCTYYNQTEFWREALGFCLKKDGEVCHVTRVGAKCVAAHSADTPPVLMAVGARAHFAGPGWEREVAVEELFVADGIRNVRLEPGELLTAIEVPGPHALPHAEMASQEPSQEEGTPAPAARAGLRRLTGYSKLRQRGSIDFPLLTVAVALWVDEEERIAALRGVVTGLGARPRMLSGWDEIAVGERLTPEVVEALAERAHEQCRPLENMIVDPEWRRAMVPFRVRRALEGVA